MQARCVLAFAGHMIDKPDRPSPRFPPWAESAVRSEIRRAIMNLSPVAAVSSAACGGDIIFAEEILEQGIPLYIILPFQDRRDFTQRCVAFAGEQWVERFLRVCKQATVDPFATKPGGYRSDQDFEDNQRAIIFLSLGLAQGMNQQLICLLLLDYTQPGDAIGGTRNFLELGVSTNLPHKEISLDRVREDLLSEEERKPIAEFDHALKHTLIESIDLIEAAEEVVHRMSKLVDIKLDLDASPQLINRLCRVDINISQILDLPSFPKVIPVFFSQSPVIEHSDAEVIKDLLVESSSERVALIVLPGDKLEDARRMLDTRICKPYACDIALLGHNRLQSVVRSLSPTPNELLRRSILAQVNVLNYSPFVVSGPTSGHAFFGREMELRGISEHVRTTSFAIVGGRRIGKTSILLQLHARLSAINFCTLYHDCAKTPTYETFLDHSTDDWRPESPLDAPATFRDLLQSTPDGRLLVLLLDEADKLIPADRENNWRLFNTLRALASSGNAQFVICGERTLRDALRDPTSPLFNFADEMLLGLLDSGAVEELVTRPMKQLEIEMVDEKKIVDSIWAFTSGHPNVVQRLCHRLIERLNEQGTRRIAVDDVSAVIEAPQFQEVDFLQTYWEAASPLEKIITLLLSREARACRLKEARRLLSEQAGIQPSATATKEALDRLVDLRSILKRSQAGYSFAVEAFPRVLANTTTVEDLLEVLVEQYDRTEARA